jgi:hypothetical protein
MTTDLPPHQIDVAAIMEQIRTEIEAQKQQLGTVDHNRLQHNRRFSRELYDQLGDVYRSNNILLPQIELIPSAVPLVGPVIDKLKLAIHRLVIFYVSRLAEQQHKINNQMLFVLRTLVDDLENERPEGENKQ